MQQPLNVTLVPEPRINGLVAALVGDASLAQMSALERASMKIAAQRPHHLIFDLAGLTFLASLAMGEFVRINHAVKEFGGRVVIAAPRPEVKDALLRARLHQIMPIYDTVDDAIAALPKSPAPSA